MFKRSVATLWLPLILSAVAFGIAIQLLENQAVIHGSEFRRSAAMLCTLQMTGWLVRARLLYRGRAKKKVERPPASPQAVRFGARTLAVIAAQPTGDPRWGPPWHRHRHGTAGGVEDYRGKRTHNPRVSVTRTVFLLIELMAVSVIIVWVLHALWHDFVQGLLDRATTRDYMVVVSFSLTQISMWFWLMRQSKRERLPGSKQPSS